MPGPEGGIRTPVGISRQIYSLMRLTTPPPLVNLLRLAMEVPRLYHKRK